MALFAGFGFTVIVTVSLVLTKPSFPVSCSTYVPSSEKATVVAAAAAFANVTGAGPLTFVHRLVTPVPGAPSSVTEPESVATFAGRVIAAFGPALTKGG